MKKQGTRGRRNLSGVTRDEMPVELVIGIWAILEKLKEHFQPYLEPAMHKRGKASEHIIRAEAAFARLQDEGVWLQTKVQGLAALTSVQEHQVSA